MVSVSSVRSLEINCNFHVKYWENMGHVYTCSVENLSTTSPNENVTDVLGDHLTGKSNKDVLKLNIDDQLCNFLPHGFEKFFPNLEGLRVANSLLVELRQSDIRVFPHLRNCDIFNYIVELLEKNLFTKNPNLEYLYFGDNRIAYVGFNILKPLKKIHKAVFQGNSCIRSNADSALEIAKLQLALNEMCSTFPDKDSRKIDEFEEELESGGSKFALWTFSILGLIAIAFAITFILKKRRENKLRHTESVTGFLPPYNEMFPEPTAPYAGDSYDNGTTNLFFNQMRHEPIS